MPVSFEYKKFSSSKFKVRKSSVLCVKYRKTSPYGLKYKLCVPDVRLLRVSAECLKAACVCLFCAQCVPDVCLNACDFCLY